MFFDPAIVSTLKLKEKTSEQREDETARGLVFKTRSSEKQLRRWRRQFTRQTH